MERDFWTDEQQGIVNILSEYGPLTTTDIAYMYNERQHTKLSDYSIRSLLVQMLELGVISTVVHIFEKITYWSLREATVYALMEEAA